MAAPMKKAKDLPRKVQDFAVISRLFVVLIQIVSNIALPDHDAGVFNPPQAKQDKTAILDTVVSLMFSGFRRWDAIYFTHIAQYLYTFENCLAFFPVYPMFVKLSAHTVFYPLQFIMSTDNVTLLTGVLLNIFLFVQTAKSLLELGQIVLKNDLIAYKAALLFCINPASIFMTAPYSEILYMYLTVQGLLFLGKEADVGSSIMIGLASATRSNGVINSFYMLYKYFKATVYSFRSLLIMKNEIPVLSLVWIFMLRVLLRCVPVVITFLPFLLYQYYCFRLYCMGKSNLDIPQHLEEYGKSLNLKILGQDQGEWCSNGIPLAYSYIQRKYWDQGFLNYWEFKQIPNFLLATPVTILVFCLACNFYRNNRYICQTLGLDDEGALRKDDPQNHKEFQMSGSALLPYIIHAVFLTLFGIFCIHVQVLTRLLFSSVPALYWYAAHLITPSAPVQPVQNQYAIFMKTKAPAVETPENTQSFFHNLLTRQIVQFKQQNFHTRLVFSYFLGYFVVGTIMFSNFLPWT